MPRDMSRFEELALRESGEVIVLLDVDGAVVWVSPSATDVSGFEPEELLGPSFWRSLVHPDDVELLAAEPEPHIVRFRLEHKTLGYRKVELRYRPLHDDPDDLSAVVTVRAVTGGQPERAIGNADGAELARFMAITTDAITLSAGGKVVWASTSTEELLGVGAGEVVGVRLEDVIHPDDAATVGEMRGVLMAGEPAVGLLHLRNRDGTFHLVEMQVVQLGDPADVHGFRISRIRRIEQSEPSPEEAAPATAGTDVGDRRAAAEDPYRFAVDNVADPITITEEGTLLWASPSFGVLLGEDVDDLVGHQMLGRVHPEDLDAVRTARASVPDPLGTTEPITITFRIRRRDGSWRWVENHIVPLPRTPGLPVRAVATWRNVDRHVDQLDSLARSEARSRELADQLQGALESRVVIEQAKGMLAAQRGIGVDEAFVLLRTHARSRGVKLPEVARAVVDLGLRL